ncbi:MAG: TAXI family TRAP transporter solute-binding subunit [Hyphomicrobiales bacterium]
MKFTSFKKAAVATLTTASLIAGVTAVATAAEERNYILSTASTGGTYYPVGVAIATLTKVKLQPKQKISMSAINSAGSGENVRLLRENEAQFAIIQGLFGHYAATGTGPVKADGPQKDLRSVSMLWQNVEQFVISADAAKTGTIEDIVALKGKPMAFGKQKSGTIGSNRTVLSGFGLDIDSDFSLFHGGYGPSADAVADGKASGAGLPAGVPTGAVTKLLAAKGDSVKLLSFTDEQAAKADGGKGLWTKYTIPAGTYPGQDKDVNTIAQPNFLAVRSDVDEDAVYMITKTMYENLPFLNAIHKATKAMAVERAVAGLPLPLHPGAAKFYKEVGISIPDSLIAK